ncbi:MarR family transcriptional regulator [Myroides ceti]|uniref:MarR family transcriptional regulator n=1 Tax=Paenimyroides ceti TaxID=395087 RepID=A0ABT8CN10_9FLAO|nr:MarR family transcriptional regulator [Paenimyroides ceti]MDN3705904.1 MarR family transcriptional regulator [Paenimyroides ceti]
MKDLLQLKEQVCFPVYALSREITQHYRPLLDELGLTYPQYLVLLVLWENKKQTVNQLGEKLRLDTGTLTPLLKRMEQKNIISRNRSSQDERVVEITLTDTGNALSEKAQSIPMKMIASMGISLDDLEALKRIANKILNK